MNRNQKFKPSLDMVFKLNEEDLQGYLYKTLVMFGKAPISSRDYVYAPGKIPVLLVAHMDTVHTETPTICKSSDGNIMMAPEGIGGDDRCGVWIVLQVLQKYDCHILFTQDEEVGALGAKAFTQSGLMPDVNFIVQPDRKGSTDAVYYDCGNDEFMEMVSLKTGYKESFGSFSDISYLAPYMDRAAVNLSSGYHSPHMKSEYVVMDQVKDTIQAITNMLEGLDETIVYPYNKVVYQKYAPPSGYKKYTPYSWSTSRDDINDIEWDEYYNEKYGKTTTTHLSLVSDTSSSVIDIDTEEEEEEFLPDGKDYTADKLVDMAASTYEGFLDDLIDMTEGFLTELLGVRPDGKDIEEIGFLVWDELVKMGYVI